MFTCHLGAASLVGFEALACRRARAYPYLDMLDGGRPTDDGNGMRRGRARAGAGGSQK